MRRIETRIPIALLLSVLFLLGVSGLSSASQYSDWPSGAGAWNNSFSMGVQLGIPYAMGVDLSTQINPLLSTGLGVGFVPGMFTFGGQVRMNLLAPGADKTIPFLGAGINQYWLEDNKINTEAVATHFLAGAEHLFGPDLGLGMYLGYIKTLSKSDDNSVKVWGINDDMSKLFLGIEGRYYF